jgi:hypothetical protein
VIGYNQDNYYVNVELYPSDPTEPGARPMETGPIPLGSIWSGNGFGVFCPPNIGDLIMVEYQEGSFQNAFATQRFFLLGGNLSVPSGEFWIVHETGSYFKMTNDGKVEIHSAVEINVTAPIVNVNSEQVNLGKLTDALTGLMNEVAVHVYNDHTHEIISPDVTEIPNQQLDHTSLTTHVQGN